MTERVCSCCKISKPFTNEFYYIGGNHEAKCRKCKRITIGDKNTREFMETIDTENWKNHPDYPHFYFERNSDNIFNAATGKYLANPRTFVNKTKKNVKTTKWRIFIGEIPENKVVKTKEGCDIDSTILDTLECVHLYCAKCNAMIQNPDLLSTYCSKRCQLDIRNKKASNGRTNDIKKYFMFKFSTQKLMNNEKYGLDINYDIDYLVSLGTNCFYCNVNCTFGNKEHTPDALTFDRKHSDIGYIKENIVQCCWFCNDMKNTTGFNDWNQYINFIKEPSIFELDLRGKCFSKMSRDIDISGIFGSLKVKSPAYYPEPTSAKQTFLELVKRQNYKDSIFNFFPIVYLERNCLWNASIDAIDSSLPNEEKHRPDNLQIIPKFMNYGKNILTQEQFLKEWTKRGFKTDFSNCTVKLPDDYHKECYFNKMITK